MTERKRKVRIQHSGRQYVWTDRSGFVDENGQCVPKALEHHLQKQLSRILAESDASITSQKELVQAAAQAREQGHLERAMALCHRALEIGPSAPAATVLSACFRSQGKAEEAIAVSEPYSKIPSPPLLTTRAAAFLDLGKWQEAKPLLDRAYAISKERGGNIGEISLVYKRLKCLREDHSKNQ